MVFDKLFGNVKPPFGSSGPSSSSSLTLPHPEEPMNPSATLANTSVDAVMTRWLQDWAVPAPHWDYWKKAIDLKVYDVYPPDLIAKGLRQDTPAGTWEAGGKRYLAIKPQWLNPGVIAHEQAHNSYALLDSNRKTAFSTLYNSLKNSDSLIVHLFSINKYGLTSDIEGHAEVYRYIGQRMPEQLKPFYPMLFAAAPVVNTPAASKPVETAPPVSGKKARVIPAPAPGTRTLIDQPTLPVAVSSGDVNYLCGTCSALLIQGMVGDQFNNLVIRCPKCGSFNEM
jgi:DNA-directed RNA polymerase subunit RPC12/RpoP